MSHAPAALAEPEELGAHCLVASEREVLRLLSSVECREVVVQRVSCHSRRSFVLFCFGLVRFGFGLVWFGWVGFGLVWFAVRDRLCTAFVSPAGARQLVWCECGARGKVGKRRDILK